MLRQWSSEREMPGWSGGSGMFVVTDLWCRQVDDKAMEIEWDSHARTVDYTALDDHAA